MAAPKRARGKNGRLVAIGMVALWLAVLVAVYVVIVRLKLGGEEGIMRDDRPAPAVSAEPADG